jgi:hypothetical protein
MGLASLIKPPLRALRSLWRAARPAFLAAAAAAAAAEAGGPPVDDAALWALCRPWLAWWMQSLWAQTPRRSCCWALPMPLPPCCSAMG